MEKEKYIKAIKRAERLIWLENKTGFVSMTKIHKSKKIYDRKKFKLCLKDFQ